MGWIIANTNEVYDGETHELAGRTFTGKTRTSESRRLEWVELTVKSKAPAKKKRARDTKGRLKADDPSTPDVNEAYEQ
jgi:hypothetical protein|tara:strand:+ start:86 stop:319 length:234 start_codon:yes stop_codon:yes gene_type:complete